MHTSRRVVPEQTRGAVSRDTDNPKTDERVRSVGDLDPRLSLCTGAERARSLTGADFTDSRHSENPGVVVKPM